MGKILLPVSVFVLMNLLHSLPYLSDINNAFDKAEDKTLDNDVKVDIVKRGVDLPFQLPVK